VLHYQAPLYNDKNGKLVKTLLKVFNEKTGSNAKPIAIGGGTYARAIKNGVAFGASFDEVAHVPNEKQSPSNYELCFDIYYDAIKELTK
jgi:succinyl-diaminopimelate desuccinylase